jgi:FkbM family methyltransferase
LDKLAQAMRSELLRRALLRHGVLAGAEHRTVLRRRLNAVVDIGANRGQFSLAVRRWAPQARIVAFEPLDKPAQIFRRVFSGDAKVTLHQCAIGGAPAMQTMHISARDDSSSLLPIAAAQTAMFPGTQEVGTIQVRVATLAELVDAAELTSPAMLKLDVQGYELNTLKGCEPLLRHFDWIYCECSYVEFYAGQELAGEIIAWLLARGFVLQESCNAALDPRGQTVQADLLFKQTETMP